MQEKEILKGLLAGERISPLEALKKYGSFRLGARICNLRKEGYPIETEIVSYKKARFAEYFIRSENMRAAKEIQKRNIVNKKTVLKNEGAI